MSKLNQTKIPVIIDEDVLLKIGLDGGVIENEFNWKLVRKNDEVIKKSKEVMWIEFNDEGHFKAKHNKPAIGYSLLMSPFNKFFTWQTTAITEIVEEGDDYVKFKTQNSNYELSKIKK